MRAPHDARVRKIIQVGRDVRLRGLRGEGSGQHTKNPGRLLAHARLGIRSETLLERIYHVPPTVLVIRTKAMRCNQEGVLIILSTRSGAYRPSSFLARAGDM